MGPARHYSDLIVWQLGHEIRIEVFKLTEKPRFNADFKARSQAEDTANSITRNIAEGFGCETHAEFARFLEISRRSLNELHDVLHGAELKKYVSASELMPIWQLSSRLYPAFSRFIAYLKRTPNVRPKRGNQPRGATDRTRNGTTVRKRPHGSPKKGHPTSERDRADVTENDRTDKNPDRTDKDRDRTDKNRDRTNKKRGIAPTSTKTLASSDASDAAPTIEAAIAPTNVGRLAPTRIGTAPTKIGTAPTRNEGSHRQGSKSH